MVKSMLKRVPISMLKRVPMEFVVWAEMRKQAIAKQVGMQPQKIKFTKLLRLISKTNGIYIENNVLHKFFGRRKI